MNFAKLTRASPLKNTCQKFLLGLNYLKALLLELLDISKNFAATGDHCAFLPLKQTNFQSKQNEYDKYMVFVFKIANDNTREMPSTLMWFASG